MIKKEERSEITVPTNISTGRNSISVPVPFSVLTQQNSIVTNQINLANQINNQLTNSTQQQNQTQLSGQPASVISMSWTPAVQSNSTTPTINNTTNTNLTATTINPQLRTPATIVNNSIAVTNNTAAMPINAIQNTSHTVLSSTAAAVHLATVPTSAITTQAARPNLNVIQDNRSHQSSSTPTAHNNLINNNNHSLHNNNLSNNQSTNLHHVTNNANIVQQQQQNSTSSNSNTANTAQQQQHHQSISNNQQSQTSNSTQQQQGQFQRLKVEDALSYLDQVKDKFSNQPQVYNDFLDIMKEFKSQSIDTPGVIRRVSNLFRGHPELIVGFNTFLPPGYKIEMQANDQVNVSMPNRATSAIIISGPGSLTQTNNPIQSSVISQTSSLPNNIQQAQQQQSASVHLSNTSSAASVNPLNSNVNSNNSGKPLNFISTASSNALHSSMHSNLSNSTNNQLNRQQNNLIDHQINNLNNSSSNLLSASNGQQHLSSNNPSQPVEFNHAINYVNKIKNRFHSQPDVYKQFLEILHAYQKEQKSIKEGKQLSGTKPLTESEVYHKVEKLFQNQEDLLQEFGQFLPESNSGSMGGNSLFGPIGNLQNSSVSTVHSAAQHVDNMIGRGGPNNDHHGTIVKRPIIRNSNNMNNLNQQNVSQLHSKRGMVNSSSNFNQNNLHSSNKKPKMTSLKDVSFAEASKLASLNEYAFFDKVRKALKNPDVYENFLRFLVLYNNEIISKVELLNLMQQFLGKHPELLKWFKDFLGHKSQDNNSLSNNQYHNSQYNHSSNVNSNSNNFFDGLSNRAVGIRERERERINSEVGMEIDYNSCKRYGASYRALPKNYVQPKCTGRTQLCRDVLNDIWVSFPSWSEDSTFVTSRKTQYEEYIYRCEDERFELDVVIETNLTAIRTFEALQKKLNRMTPEERSKFKLDDTLGGSSVVIIQRAIKRIYGDKAPEIVEGLKKSPAVAVPLVYRRLRAKEEEWREAQKQFNKIWREQNEKYYLKSLDHQSITFKQNDIKFLRSKSLIHEIESIFDERHEQNEDKQQDQQQNGPHMEFIYKNKSMIEEACNLLIHHVKRQTSIHKSDKQKIKQLLKHFIPDFFGTQRGELSDDEQEEETDQDEERNSTAANSGNNNNSNNNNNKDNKDSSTNKDENKLKSTLSFKDQELLNSNNKDNQKSTCPNLSNSSPNDSYTLFIVNQSWYLFFRLHYILCDRLSKMQERALKIAEEDSKEKAAFSKKESPAVALRLKHKTEYEVSNYFGGLIEMVKQLLDGNLDSNQFEDQLREMFGIYAYISFTLDKVVQNLVRQLQHIVCEESSVQTTELFLEASKVNATGGSCSTAHLRLAPEYSYQKKAESILTEENVFKIYLFKDEGKLTIELLDSESTDSEDESTPTIKWSDYINKYAKDNSHISDSLKERLMKKPLFLLRNMRPLKEANSRDLDVLDKEENIEKATKSLEINDNQECKFDVNSYKAVFLTDSGSLIYRTKSLSRARKVQKQIFDKCKFNKTKFYKDWLKKNCSKERQSIFDDWYKGKCYETAVTKNDKESIETISLKTSPAQSSNKNEEIKLNEEKIIEDTKIVEPTLTTSIVSTSSSTTSTSSSSSITTNSNNKDNKPIDKEETPITS